MEEAYSQCSGTADAGKRVRPELRRISAELRQRHSWLAHQHAIGLGISAISCAGIVTAGYLYAAGLTPAWLTIASAALFMSQANGGSLRRS